MKGFPPFHRTVLREPRRKGMMTRAGELTAAEVEMEAPCRPAVVQGEMVSSAAVSVVPSRTPGTILVLVFALTLTSILFVGSTTNTTYLRMRLQGPTGQRRSRIPPRAFIPPANREQVPREGAAEGAGAEGKPDAGHADGLVNATLLHSYARPRDRARRLLSQRLVQ